MPEIKDVIPFQFTLEEGEGKKPKIKGAFGIIGKPTLNGRVYRKEIVEREINKLKDKIKERSLFGELDHPDSRNINLKNVSHLITDLRIEGDKVIGEAEILETPAGQILLALSRANAKIGISSRGFGSVKKAPDGNEVVADDYHLITYDIVATPAAGTYPNVVYEHLEGEEKMTLEEFKEKYADLLDVYRNEVIIETASDMTKEIEALKNENKSLKEQLDLIKTEYKEYFKDEILSELKNMKGEIEKKLQRKYGFDIELPPDVDIDELVEFVDYAISGKMAEEGEKLADALGRLENEKKELELTIEELEEENKKLKETIEEQAALLENAKQVDYEKLARQIEIRDNIIQRLKQKYVFEKELNDALNPQASKYRQRFESEEVDDIKAVLDEEIKEKEQAKMEQIESLLKKYSGHPRYFLGKKIVKTLNLEPDEIDTLFEILNGKQKVDKKIIDIDEKIVIDEDDNADEIKADSTMIKELAELGISAVDLHLFKTKK